MIGLSVLQGIDILLAALQLILAALLAVSIFIVLRSVRSARQPPVRGRKLTYRTSIRWRSKQNKALGPARRAFMAETQALLAACGLRVEADLYLSARRLFIGASATIVLLISSGAGASMLQPTSRVAIWSAFALLLGAAMADKPILRKLQVARRYRVMREVDMLSRQLLYYSGLHVNLHSKLMRCLPFTRILRKEWYQLTSEWYQNADRALRNFRERVATEEGNSFAETLSALRQYDNDRYYELLKQRIADYKEKLSLHKESRKESLSYILFVISGIPILFTFRLFVYPWVAEGQKLFESLS